MLEIKQLKVAVEGKILLSEFTLTVRKAEIHAIMGPNGAGKSTFARVLAGDPAYQIVEGEILLDGCCLNSLSPEKRAHMGLFVGFQYPLEVPGLSNVQFLHAMHSAKRKTRGEIPLSEEEFQCLLCKKNRQIGLKAELKERSLNAGFSGGEKKRNEILQMALLEPKVALLDELDSGLDIDALKEVGRAILNLMTEERSLILITHYQRLLNHIRPHFVHVVQGGRLVQTGGAELATALEERGYQS